MNPQGLSGKAMASPLAQGLLPDQAGLEAVLLDSFSRYVAIGTQSDGNSTTCPSTPGQWVLARLLACELRSLGLQDVQVSEHGYVHGVLPASPGHDHGPPGLCLLAHMDTSPDCPGDGVRLIVHRRWDGTALKLPGGGLLNPVDFPGMEACRGMDILSSDGTTLLGADDKAGIAEIMAVLHCLTKDPGLRHGGVEVIFTPDEEIGRGTDLLPPGLPRAPLALTMDGDGPGSYNASCFNAVLARVVFHGRIIHPGSARGQLVNPLTMAASFISALPRNESPEATDGDYGFYYPQTIEGGPEGVALDLLLRDFDSQGMNRRMDCLEKLAAATLAAFPGGRVELEFKPQYRNMEDDILTQAPWVLPLLEQAIAGAGLTVRPQAIRGGTDGARLTSLGTPCPNLFTGGQGFHSLTEWVCLQTMVAAVRTVLNFLALLDLRSQGIPGESGC